MNIDSIRTRACEQQNRAENLLRSQQERVHSLKRARDDDPKLEERPLKFQAIDETEDRPFGLPRELFLQVCLSFPKDQEYGIWCKMRLVCHAWRNFLDADPSPHPLVSLFQLERKMNVLKARISDKKLDHTQDKIFTVAALSIAGSALFTFFSGLPLIAEIKKGTLPIICFPSLGGWGMVLPDGKIVPIPYPR